MNLKLPEGYYWKRIGICNVDSGQILLCDPSYIINKDENFLGECYTTTKDQTFQLYYPLGHAGLGVVTYTYAGDGSYNVYNLYKDKDPNPLGTFIDFYGVFEEEPQ